jgi:hypothetical protein
MRRSTTVCCTVLLGAILAGHAAAASTPAAGPQSAKPKASSFAPHTGSHQHAYGTPVQAPILHRRRPALRTQPSGAAHDPKVTAS